MPLYELQFQDRETKNWLPSQAVNAKSRRQAIRQLGYRQPRGLQSRVVKSKG